MAETFEWDEIPYDPNSPVVAAEVGTVERNAKEEQSGSLGFLSDSLDWFNTNADVIIDTTDSIMNIGTNLGIIKPNTQQDISRRADEAVTQTQGWVERTFGPTIADSALSKFGGPVIIGVALIAVILLVRK